MKPRSKRTSQFRKVALAGCTVMAAAVVIAGSFSANWFTVESGGTLMKGGGFKIEGVVGQFDAGKMSGGDFEIDGGFLAGAITDCNANLIIDAEEIASGSSLDCNTNSIPDACDLATGASADINVDGIPDECGPLKFFSAWTGANDMSSWDLDSNWNPASAPDNMPTASSPETYCVTIGTNGPHNVSAPAFAVEIETLDIGDASGISQLNILNLMTVNLQTNVHSNGIIVLSNNGASLAGGPVTIDASGALLNSGVGGNAMEVLADITNAGTVTAGASQFLNLLGGKFSNLSGGLVDVKSGSSLFVTGTSLAQSGTLAASGGATVSFTGAELVNSNGGVINLTGATLNVPLGLRNLSGGVVTSAAISAQIDGNVVNAGLFSFSNNLTLNGDVTVLPGGTFDVAGDFAITGGTTNAVAVTGGSMVLNTTGSGVLNAANVFVNGDPGGATRLELRGDVFAQVQSSVQVNPCSGLFRGCTPPLLNISENALLDVAADISFGNFVQVNVSSSLAVELGGDFNNAITAGALFDWSQGHLLMDGSTPQTFEAAGADVGTGLTGTINNFLIGTLEVAAPSTVVFTNTTGNAAGTLPCQEAVYVRTLILRNGSTIDLGNTNLYYGDRLDEGATITASGCGQLVHNPTGDADANGIVDLLDYAAMSACLESSGLGSALLSAGCGVFDFDSSGDVDLRDFAAFSMALAP